MRDYMMALHQRFCKEPECREIKEQIREVEQELHQKLDRRGQEQLLKLAEPLMKTAYGRYLTEVAEGL